MGDIGGRDEMVGECGVSGGAPMFIASRKPFGVSGICSLSWNWRRGGMPSGQCFCSISASYMTCSHMSWISDPGDVGNLGFRIIFCARCRCALAVHASVQHAVRGWHGAHRERGGFFCAAHTAKAREKRVCRVVSNPCSARARAKTRNASIANE